MTTHEQAVKAAEWISKNICYVQPHIPYPDGQIWAFRPSATTKWLTDAELIAEAERLGWKE